MAYWFKKRVCFGFDTTLFAHLLSQFSGND